MSSLVTDLLYSAGELKKEDIPSKIEKSRRNIEDIKIEVQENLKSLYVDFIPQYIKLDKLSLKLDHADKEFDGLVDHVEKEVKPQMSGTIAEFHSMLENLKKIKALKSAVSSLINFHSYLDATKDALAENQLLKATKSLLQVQDAVNIIGKENQSPELYCALITDMYETKERIMCKLDEIWDKKLCISQSTKNKKFETTLLIDLTSFIEIDSLLQSLENLGYLKDNCKKYCANFLKLAVEPIIQHKTMFVKPDDKVDKPTLVLHMLKEAPSPSEVFDILTNLFTFVHEFLGRRKTVPVRNCEDGSSGDTIMSKLGTIIAKDFSSLLVEKCIKIAIPSQSQQLEAFNRTITQAVNFHNFLLELRFFKTKENALMDFIQNVDVLPANRMAQDILNRARSLMKEDLHKTVMVGVQECPPPSLVKGTGDLNDRVKTQALSKSSFSFPQCQISQFAKSLAKLMDEVMQEAKQTTSSYSARLYYTVRNICELYCAVVPVYHKEEIETLPQQTAVHHNNSMYIAHCLLTLGSRYELALPLSVPVTFVDLVPELRKSGVEAFLAQMRRQRQQLLLSLKEESVFQNIDCDEGVFPKAEKAVHQCLCQLGLLKKVWADVLPVDVYFKAIGTLLNTCLEEIILSVASMEDIAASASAQLDSVFSIVLKQAPSLFTVTSVDKSDHIHLYVRKWFKFQELQLVLGASMQEIVDRWSSGKGPLASHFSADEVKHLIRALFQNTERRAAALGRIH